MKILSIKGITNVFSTIDEVWNIKSGVCQDFTTIMIQFCGLAKIPTRYVSGYVYASEGFRGARDTYLGWSLSLDMDG